MGCPDDDALDRFARGELADAERDSVEAHVDTCDDCGRIVVELARAFGSDSGPHPLATYEGEGAELPLAPFMPGTIVGRYRIVERVGSGAMGVVYRALDPVLDRSVALKFLHRVSQDELASKGRERLEREGQALARLTHPNVVAVHDVGAYEGHQFVAMEFVQGDTLTHWLKAQARSVRAILDVFAAAGEGLAAAHDAGLVHRDFKPDNVLVTEDGGVRVTDFGLARLHGGLADDDDSADSGEASDPRLTRTGVLIGTPAYCAPEQFDGAKASPASDQFSFCVALYRALFGTAPFAGNSVGRLAQTVTGGELAPMPATPTVGRRVRRALRRGLSVAADDRFESMHALLADLRPARRGSIATALAVPLTAVAVTAAAWAAWGSDESPLPLCENGITEVWNAPRSKAIGAAFARTGVPHAPGTWGRAVKALDDYAARYADVLRTTCPSSALAERASGETLVRVLCLERQREEFAAQLAVLEDATSEVVDNALEAISGLEDPKECHDAKPPPPELGVPVEAERVAVEKVRALALQSTAHHRAGRYDDALRLADEAWAVAETIDYAPARAEALLRRGNALAATGSAKDAAVALREAAYAATAARHHIIAARAWAELVYTLGTAGTRPEAAMEAGAIAQAEIVAAGGDESLEAGILSNLGAAALQRAQPEEGIELFERALVIRERRGQALRVADLKFNIANGLLLSDRPDEAAAAFQALIATYRDLLGAKHPEVVAAQHARGKALAAAGRYADSIAECEAAKRAMEAAGASDKRAYANVIADLGAAKQALGQYDASERLLRQALEIMRAELGPEHNSTVNSRLVLADALMGMDRYEEAEAEARAVIRMREHKGSPHYSVALASLGQALSGQKRFDEAKAVIERGVQETARLHGEDHPNVAAGIGLIADLLFEQGDERGALAAADRYFTAESGRSLPQGPFIRFIAARAQWHLGQRDKARKNADLAISSAKAFAFTPLVAEVEAWLLTLPAGK